IAGPAAGVGPARPAPRAAARRAAVAAQHCARASKIALGASCAIRVAADDRSAGPLSSSLSICHAVAVVEVAGNAHVLEHIGETTAVVIETGAVDVFGAFLKADARIAFRHLHARVLFEGLVAIVTRLTALAGARLLGTRRIAGLGGSARPSGVSGGRGI